MQLSPDRFYKYAVITAFQAGELIMDVYENEDIQVTDKSDNSPITQADRRAHEHISNVLEGTGYPVLSEEGASIDYATRSGWEAYWLVDPLDGTREFIGRNGEFTVNIAWMVKNRPSMGVVYAPALRKLYFTFGQSINHMVLLPEGIDDLYLSNLDPDEYVLKSSSHSGFIVLGSRSHQSQEALNLIEKLEEIHHETTLISRGSSLKFCTLASGEADFYPRLGRTMEWDTAAGHAIAESAGFEVLQLPGLKTLEYNKNDLANPWFLVVKPGQIEEWKTRGLHLENTIKKEA